MAEDPFAAAVTDVSMLDPFAAAVTDATLPHCAASPREVPEADVNTANPSGAPNAGQVAMTPPGKKKAYCGCVLERKRTQASTQKCSDD